MNCPNCGSESGEEIKSCSACGWANGATGAAAAPENSASRSEAATTERPRRELWTAIRILLVVAWSFAVTFERFSISAESFGYAVGALILPFVIAYVIARKQHGWARFSYWFLGLGVLFSLGSLVPNSKSLSNLSRTDLLKELAGTKPVDAGLSPQDRETVNVSRAIFSDLQESVKTYQQNLTALRPDIKTLFTSDSFTSRAKIEKALKVLDQVMVLDRGSINTIENIPNTARLRVEQSHLSEKDQISFLQGLTSAFRASNIPALGKSAVDAEQAWVDAAADLYRFADEHAGEISTKNGRLAIGNDATRAQFNAKVRRTQELRQEFLAAKKQFDEAQNATLKIEGVSRADLGVGN